MLDIMHQLRQGSQEKQESLPGSPPIRVECEISPLKHSSPIWRRPLPPVSQVVVEWQEMASGQIQVCLDKVPEEAERNFQLEQPQLVLTVDLASGEVHPDLGRLIDLPATEYEKQRIVALELARQEREDEELICYQVAKLAQEVAVPKEYTKSSRIPTAEVVKRKPVPTLSVQQVKLEARHHQYTIARKPVPGEESIEHMCRRPIRSVEIKQSAPVQSQYGEPTCDIDLVTQGWPKGSTAPDSTGKAGNRSSPGASPGKVWRMMTTETRGVITPNQRTRVDTGIEWPRRTSSRDWASSQPGAASLVAE